MRRASKGYTSLWVTFPLFPTMLVQGPILQGKGSTVPVEFHHTPSGAPPTSQPPVLSPSRIPTKQETEKEVPPKIVVSEDEKNSEDTSKQGRMIEDIDQDAGIYLVTPTKVSSQEDQFEDQLGVLSASKVLADATKKNVNTYTRRRRAVSTTGASMPVSTAESEKLKKIKKRVQIQMSLDEELTQKLHEEEQARFNARTKKQSLNAEQERATCKYMHDPLTWRLYNTCGIHHVSTDRGHDIFMLVEKDYPLTRGLLTLMLCNKLMKHRYQWPWHRDHFEEEFNVFYKPFPVIESIQRLAIPSDFLEIYPMHMYTKALMRHNGFEHMMRVRIEYHKEDPERTNHVNVLGQWRSLARDNGFDYHKPIRFRYMHEFEDVEAKNEADRYGMSFGMQIWLIAIHQITVSKSKDRETMSPILQTTMKRNMIGYVAILEEPKEGKITEKRTRMLADSKLPTTFWAEAVNTACYVQNRVLVVKPHNKTPYELFHGRTPTLSFMRPFGCPVTILNTIDHLGKFDGKADEGSGPDWLFDIDALTRTMNYEPIVAGTQSNGFVGTKASDNADPKSSHDDGSKPSSDDGNKVDEDPRKDSECNDQEKEDNVNNTNNVNAASTNEVNAVGGKTSIELPFDPNMHALEDYSIFDFLRNDEDEVP
ncbi:ribonuclease H-like domain-containing protein [Tanacetum coccineum]